MSQKIWRYTMTLEEQKLWNTEGLGGWRKAMQACVEDDARAEGCKKYILYDTAENVLIKGDVFRMVERHSASLA